MGAPAGLQLLDVARDEKWRVYTEDEKPRRTREIKRVKSDKC